MPNFRSMQGAFVKAYRGTASKRNEAGGGKVVKVAPERVSDMPWYRAIFLVLKAEPFEPLLEDEVRKARL